MDKNHLKAIIACLVVFFLYQKFGLLGGVKTTSVQPALNVSTQVQSQNNNFSTQKTFNNSPEVSQSGQPVSSSPISKKTEQSISPIISFKEVKDTLLSPELNIEITNRGGSISSSEFPRFETTHQYENAWSSPLAINRLGSYTKLENMEFSQQKDADGHSVTFYKEVAPGIELKKIIQLSNMAYLYRVTIIIKNKNESEAYFPDGMEINLGQLSLNKDKAFPQLGFTYFSLENKAERIDYNDVETVKTINEPLHWAAIQNDTYASIISESNERLRGANWHHAEDSEKISGTAKTSDFTIPSDGEKVFNFNYYLGPKLYFHLKNLNLSYENVIDYGSILGGITKPLVLLLNYLKNIVGSYGIAIILLTLLFKVITYPLTKKSVTSMKGMQEIQPKMKEIQKQYKDNPKRMNAEMIQLYKKHKVNPAGGCLPILIQIPIFIAFYKAIGSSVELQGESFLLIKDLASPDALINLGSFSINVLPIIMGVSQLLSQQQTASSDPSQKQMMYIMTIGMTFIFYSFPSGLVLYWLVSNLIGIAQNAMIKANTDKA